MADNPNNLTELLDTVKNYGFEYFGIFYGNYRGVIVDNNDPEKLGRVKLRVPQIASDNTIEYWAWPKGQPTGADFGDFMVPPKNSPVWVEFENGDPRHPIYSGGHWGKSFGAVPSEGQLTDPKNRVRKSEDWILEMDDAGNKFKASNKTNGDKFELNGRDFKVDVGGDIRLECAGDKRETISGDTEELVSGASTEQITGPKSITCQTFGITAIDPGTFNLGGVSISYNGSSLTITAGSVVFTVGTSGVVIQGRNFLDHTHDGVAPGGSNTGDVN